MEPHSPFDSLPVLHKGELLFRGNKILSRKPSFFADVDAEKDPFISRKKNGNAAVVQKEKVMIKSLTQPMAFDG